MSLEALDSSVSSFKAQYLENHPQIAVSLKGPGSSDPLGDTKLITEASTSSKSPGWYWVGCHFAPQLNSFGFSHIDRLTIYGNTQLVTQNDFGLSTPATLSTKLSFSVNYTFLSSSIAASASSPLSGPFHRLLSFRLVVSIDPY
jgi:hypothetical protein